MAGLTPTGSVHETPVDAPTAAASTWDASPDGDSGLTAARPGGPGREWVVAVHDEPMTLTTLVWTCLLGAVSALLLLAMVDPGVQLGGLTLDSGLGFVVILWLSAWLLSSWGFTQRTRGLLEVTRRACTVVALECLVLGLWFRAEPLAGAATRGAAMGPASPSAAGNSGLAEQLAGTPATVGLWICLVVWLACRLLSAPPQPRSSSL